MTRHRLLKSAGLVSLGTLCSRLLGLVREILMARFFGVNLAASGFFVAFLIPNLLRRFFGEGALSAAFVPIYVKTREGEGEEAGWDLARNVMILVFLILSGITAVTWLAVSVWMWKGDLSPKQAAVFPLLRIMLPYMIGICLTALAMGVQNSQRKFAVPAFTPVVLNLVWILSLYLICPLFGDRLEDRIEGVAWGVLAAGILQFLIQIPALNALGMRWFGPVNLSHPKVKRILWLLGPAALGAAVTQVNVLLDKLLALWVADYGPSALQYAERLIYLPLGLFGTALSTVLLTELSSLAQRKDSTQTAETVTMGLRYLLGIMLPAAVGLAFFAEPIIRMMFARGEFGADGVLYTQRALLCYAPGLIFFSAAKILVPVFYANEDTRTPVRIGIYAVLMNIVLNLIFIFTLPEGWKHAGLALGTVLSECVQVVVLSVLVTRRYSKPDWKGIAASAFRFSIACIPLVLVTRAVLQRLSALGDVGSVLVAITAGVAVYGLTCLILRCPELRRKSS